MVGDPLVSFNVCQQCAESYLEGWRERRRSDEIQKNKAKSIYLSNFLIVSTGMATGRCRFVCHENTAVTHLPSQFFLSLSLCIDFRFSARFGEQRLFAHCACQCTQTTLLGCENIFDA